MVLSVIIIGVQPVEVKAAQISYLSDNQYYYIKNVRSSKYLTVRNGNFSAGECIVQMNYAGANHQKWKLEYVSNSGGYYRILAYNYNLAISVPNDTVGAIPSLAAKSVDSKQYIKIYGLSNAAHRFMTKKSNDSKCLVVNNASVYNNTYIIQGNTGSQWNDQWLIEPVNTPTYSFGERYAQSNYNHRLATYPDFDYYDHTEKIVYESTNFVSQCLAASGYNYYRPGQYSNSWWYVDKLNHSQNQVFNYAGLTDNWNVMLKWYEPGNFRGFWSGTKNKNVKSFKCGDIMTKTPAQLKELGAVCYKGDVIMIRNDNYNGYSHVLTMFVTSNSVVGSGNESDIRNVNVYTHKGSSGVNGSTLQQVIASLGYSDYNGVNIDIISMEM